MGEHAGNGRKIGERNALPVRGLVALVWHNLRDQFDRLVSLVSDL